jgi:diguanylate cyclase (GGDEF)-like protein
MDLFENEQQIYNSALNHICNVREGGSHKFEEYENIVNEYGKLLKHFRRVTRFSDRTTINLYENNIDLTNKVQHDPLTGIYNRRFMEDRITRYIKDLSRSGSVLSIIMLDVDFFKNYNDTYGHNAGDICLIKIAETLSQCITREDDFAARYGGEEFVIVLPHTDEKGVHITACKVLENIAHKGISHKNSSVADYVTVSLGITSIKVKYTHTCTDYLKCADEALYMSKQNGRNRYTYLQFMDYNS